MILAPRENSALCHHRSSDFIVYELIPSPVMLFLFFYHQVLSKIAPYVLSRKSHSTISCPRQGLDGDGKTLIEVVYRYGILRLTATPHCCTSYLGNNWIVAQPCYLADLASFPFMLPSRTCTFHIKDLKTELHANKTCHIF